MKEAETLTKFDPQARTITIQEKRPFGSFQVARVLKFEEIGQISYMTQLADSNGSKNAFIYLHTLAQPKQRIKVLSPNSKFAPDEFADVLEEGEAAASMMGLELTHLTGFQPLDS